MILEITSAFAKTKKFKSNVFTDVIIHTETPKAVLVSATGLISSSENCWFCNRPLSTDESMVVGVGPTCAKELGIPYPMERSEAEEWMASYADLNEEWLPKSIIRKPSQLTLDSTSVGAEAKYKKWSKGVECTGTLSIGYRPTEMHHRYKNLICLEIFCDMGSEFNNQILRIEGAEWRGGSRSQPSWRNNNKFGKDKMFTVPFSPDAATELFVTCRDWKIDLTVDQDLINLVKSRIDSAKQRTAAAEELGIETVQQIKKLTPDDLDQIDFEKIMKTEPWNHQRAAVAFCAAIMNLELPRKDSE